MNTSEIVNIALAALTIVIGFVSLYFKANTKLYAKVTGFITAAEGLYTDANSGGQKFQWVIGQLYALIPAPVRPFIPQSILATLVQKFFNQMAAYATKQLDKAAAKVTSDTTGVATK